MIFGFSENPRYPDEKPVPVTPLINPWLEVLTDETEEGVRGRSIRTAAAARTKANWSRGRPALLNHSDGNPWSLKS